MATLASIEAQLTAMQSGIIGRFNDIDAAIATLQSGIISALGDIEDKIDAPKSVQRLCAHCGGDGQKGAIGSEISCPDCGGDGYRPHSKITVD